jgi:undecaprenyl-diphosphatase
MSLDYTIAEHANRFALRHDAWEDAARVYASISEPLFIVGVVALIAVGVVLRRRALWTAGALALVAAGAALVAGVIVSHVVNRPRPFVAHPQIHSFLHHAADPGFPSDHATAAFAIGAVLVIRLGWVATPVLLAALLLSISRVMIGLHYPGDVLAGALLGIAAAALVCFAAARMEEFGLTQRIRGAVLKSGSNPP